MKKHAYLIMAFNNIEQLKLLLSMIDDSRNDIYLHIDKKSKMDISKLHCDKANLEFVKRIKVYWGGYSQIQCELALLKQAIKIKHSYYHLLSGQDLPIKDQDYIHNFFNKSNYEFVRFEDDIFKYEDRVKYYYFFRNLIGKPQNVLSRLLISIERVFIKIQKKIGVNRIKNINFDFQKGTNWFSITHELAEYIVSKELEIKNTYKYTLCCDEIFLQTIVHNSKFRNDLYCIQYNNDLKAIMRLIDWKRGNPYVFKISDVNLILNSSMIFARKFDEKIDSMIIKCLYDKLKGNY